ncbi:MAG: dTMP kinase [Anaerolineales bacterium]
MSLFITLEGPDGSGKTRQADSLLEHLRSLKLDVVLTCEPGGTPIGDQIRKVLFNLDNTAMDPRTEFLLFSASRAQHVAEKIKPLLEQGTIVLSDRFFDSSLAYQGYGHRLNLQTLWEVTKFATQGLIPDRTYLLDIPVEEGIKRRKQGGNWNRLDAFDLELHKRVRAGYLQLAEEDKDRWEVVNASRPFDEVQGSLRQSVVEFIRSHGLLTEP